MCQQLLEGDQPYTLLGLLNLFKSNENLNVFMNDKPHFHLNRIVNKQNFRYWCMDNHEILNEKLLHSPKITVWCVGRDVRVIGLYFFKKDATTVTVNLDYCIDMLIFFIPEHCRQWFNLKKIWFQ